MTAMQSPSARAPYAFELRGVERTFTEGSVPRTALTEVSLVVEAGSFVAICGPSGSGKTTLLSLLGTLDRGYQGTVHAFGSDLATLSAAALGELRNRRLGFVFQAFHLLPHLTVLDNVLLPSLFGHVRPDAMLLRAQQALDRVGLLSRGADYPTQLSGGQRQRVALARALLQSPDVILCDEPTGNLDTKTGAEIIALLSSIHAEEKKTVIVVTHEARLAAAATHRVDLLDGRIIAQVGPGAA